MNVTTQILLYALLAGLSPLALLATLAALGSGRGRLNGSAFGIGFLLTQSLVLLLAILLGTAATPGRERDHATLAAVLELVLGVALLVFASRGRRHGPEERGASRTKALLDRLGHLQPATSFSMGALLGVGGVKRLMITLVTGATIAIAGLIPAEELGLGVLYVVIGSVLVWLPVAAYLVAGKRADIWTANTQAWLIANEQRITVASTVVFGVILIVHAVILLLGKTTF